MTARAQALEEAEHAISAWEYFDAHPDRFNGAEVVERGWNLVVALKNVTALLPAESAPAATAAVVTAEEMFRWADQSQAVTWGGRLGLKERWEHRDDPEYQEMLRKIGG